MFEATCKADMYLMILCLPSQAALQAVGAVSGPAYAGWAMQAEAGDLSQHKHGAANGSS